MSPLTPTVTGSVNSYTVSPTLPAGLTLASTSGVISGTPTAGSASASYTVTATNSSGSTTAMVAITVDDTKPAISYAGRRFTLAAGTAANIVPISSTGGAATSWSITPTLPGGLALNASTGAITGTPTAVSLPASYSITATNSGGSYALGVQIQVVSKVLLDLGHGTTVTRMAASGSRLLSQDQGEMLSQSSVSRCNLWNTGTDMLVAALNCNGSAPIALAGSTAVVGGWGNLLWTDSQSTQVPSVVFSPNGTLIAAATGLVQVPGTGTNIYTNYSLTAAVNGWAVGWIDNTRLLANVYITDNQNVPPGTYSAAHVYSNTGTLVGTPALPEITALQPVATDEIFAKNRNSIYSVTTAALVFGAGNAVTYPTVPGAVADGYIASSSATGLLVADAF